MYDILTLKYLMKTILYNIEFIDVFILCPVFQVYINNKDCVIIANNLMNNI
jgi:hypothetical protein